ncbi:MAG: hypothetical protein WA484_13400 [Solirubrobacteraceae bacterium]
MLLALLAVAVLSAGVSSCGGTAATDSSNGDGPVRSFGHAAGVADNQAVAELVRRYYAAAAAHDDARACSLTYYILAESIPEEYGGPPGPQYLRGASTCQAVLSRVFEHFHTQLIDPPQVTGVRVNGDVAYALLAWRTLPAGYMQVRREGRSWKIDRVLAASLP